MTLFKRLNIPGPSPNFIFGNSLKLAKDGSVRTFPKWTQTYGPIVGFYIGGHPQLLVTDPEVVHRVLTKDFAYFANRNELIPGGPQPMLRKMLVWSHDNEWRHLRATMTSSFSAAKLRAMEPLMMSSIAKLLTELDEKAKSGQEFNVTPSIAETTFSTAAKCMLGLDLSLYKLNNEVEAVLELARPRFEKSLLAMAMILFPSTTTFLYPIRVLWEKIRFYFRWSAEGICYNILSKIVNHRKETDIDYRDFLQLLLDSSKVRSTTDDIELEMSDGATMARIMSVRGISQTLRRMSIFTDNATPTDGLTEEEVVANALLFLLGGFETTSVTLQFVIHMLINHQDIQEELREEVRRAVFLDGGTVTWESMAAIPLLEQVIKETLRIYPPSSPFTSRVTKQDYEYNDLRIPTGTGIFIGVSSIHKDPRYWPEPELFKPDRFEHVYNKLAFLPFGNGPRNCIGMRFAYAELKLVVASLVLNYKFVPGPSTESNIKVVESMAALMPKNGVFCKVIKLNN